jgi:coenzyme F420-reducing hydrogenase delta subunit
MLEEIGLEGRRIQMINVSSAMGGQFAWSAAEFTEEVRRLGPSKLNNHSGCEPSIAQIDELPSELQGG